MLKKKEEEEAVCGSLGRGRDPPAGNWSAVLISLALGLFRHGGIAATCTGCMFMQSPCHR